jgi:hypothetical protein
MRSLESTGSTVATKMPDWYALDACLHCNEADGEYDGHPFKLPFPLQNGF